MKPILWVFIILLAKQAICAPQKLDDSGNQMENNDEHRRLKRTSRNGQTQSQYLNFGDSQMEGKADAEITRYGSRASVSGTNGMGQAQSQSSGSGCDECYGSEGSHISGAARGPDPLTSTSGAGIPQSHASSQSPSGYDAYSRPYTLPSSEYSNQGFGPSAIRSSSNLKDLQTFGTGFSSTGDHIAQNGVLSVTPAPITVTTDSSGNIYQPNRSQPSNVGGSSFLNRPISNGKPKSTSSDTDHTTRPSILAGRKTIPSNLDNNSFDSSPSSFGMQLTSRPSLSNYGSTGSNFLESSLPSQRMQPNRGSYDSRIVTGGQPSPYDTSTSTTSENAFDRSRAPGAPGSGSYDRKFNKPSVNDGDRSKSTTDLISHPSNSPSLSQTSSQPSISTPSIQPGGSVSTDGSRIESPADHGTEFEISQPGTDSLSKLRNAFKLPPGLCLVRCDTLKPGEYSLTPEQIRDAFIASGLIDQRGGPGQGTAVSTVPTGSQSSQATPQYQQPSAVGSQSFQSLPQYQQPSGAGPQSFKSLPQYQQLSDSGSQPFQGFPHYQQPSGSGLKPSQGLPQYQQPSGARRQSFQTLLQYQQPSVSRLQPSQELPQYQQQSGSELQPSQPLPQYQQPSGFGLQTSHGLPQYQQPSGSGLQPSQESPQYQEPSEFGLQTSHGLPQYQQPSGSGLQPSQELPQYQQLRGFGLQPSQGLPQYQQLSGSGLQPSRGLPQYQQPSGFGLQPSQTLPQYQQPSGVGLQPSQELPQYQQPSGVHIPQSTSFPRAGLPVQTIPSANQFIPGSTVPSLNNGQLINQTGGVIPSGSYQYNVPPLGYPTIAKIPQGQVSSPGYVIPSMSSIYSVPGGAQFPGTSVQIPPVSGGVYPNVENYPGTYSSQGGNSIGPRGTPTDGSYSGVGTQGVHGIGQLSSSVPSAGNLVYGVGVGSSSSEPSQTGDVDVGPENGSASGVEEDGHSQAESSVKNGEVTASAQGTKNGGTAQTQVQGSYSGSGSFSASAQTADKDRTAQSQVTGHKDGALSSSQGSGGKSQAQSQVKVDEKTGGTSASGQSSGAKHSSQSEVVANEKGGLADAQSSGPGQTSSQAQIGFRPEVANTNPSGNIFNGGGQASAQSGVHSGQSQSQIQGSFKYGISYHGAAQAASGTKEQVSSYREISKKLFQSIGQFSRSNRGAVTQAPPSDIANINEIGLQPLPKTMAVAPDTTPDESGLDDEDYNEMNDEGEDEYNDSPDQLKEKKTRTSRVEIELPKRVESSSSEKPKEIETTTGFKMENKIADSAKLIRMPAVRSETVPDGFKGKIGEKQRSSKNQIDFDKKIDVKPDTFVTVTKSVSGSLDNSKASTDDDKKFESTYYTKTSTCGYFTFSCNIVYGSNGRSKICRPKAPENGKC